MVFVAMREMEKISAIISNVRFLFKSGSLFIFLIHWFLFLLEWWPRVCERENGVLQECFFNCLKSEKARLKTKRWIFILERYLA